MRGANHLGVLVNLILQMALGFLWYAQYLFGDAWREAIGKTRDQLNMGDPWPFVYAFFAAALLGYAVDWLLSVRNLHGLGEGIKTGLFVGLALIVPAVVTHASFLGYPASVLLINGGKELVGALIAGIVLGAWPRRY